jgi:hypothetical protein
VSEEIVRALIEEKIAELNETIREREEELSEALKEYRVTFLEQQAELLAGDAGAGYGIDHRLAPLRSLESDIFELQAWRDNWLELERRYLSDPEFRDEINEGMYPTSRRTDAGEENVP